MKDETILNFVCFIPILCYVIVCLFNDKDYTTMLTAVFLTFLPIMSVCFVHSSLSI